MNTKETIWIFRRGIALILLFAFGLAPAFAQTTTTTSTSQFPSSLSRYLDQTNGMTADEAVAYALAHNAELEATRKEIDAAKAMVKQARLRANPMLEVE